MLKQVKKLIFFTLKITRVTTNTMLAKVRLKKFGLGLTVNYKCTFTSNTVIGDYCHFNGIDVVGSGYFKVGDYFHSGSGILVITQDHNYLKPTSLPYDDKIIPRKVLIGKYCWVGSRVTFLPGAHISDGCVVQAGAVVSGFFPPGSVIGGNPARILQQRDMSAVASLVANGRFKK